MRLLSLAFVIAIVCAPLPTAAALLDGCTPQGLLAYACEQEEQNECGGFTSIGAGVTATAGFAIAGIDGCGNDMMIVTASASVLFVSAVWFSNGSVCETAIVTPAGLLATGCPVGPPPNPGWGALVP